jgi:Alpha 1,4-glycosyltransferase conserved region
MTCASTPMTIAAFPLTSRCWTPGTSLPPIVCSSTKRVSGREALPASPIISDTRCWNGPIQSGSTPMSSASRAIGRRKRRCWPPGRTRITSTARCWGFPDQQRSCRAEAERLGKDIGWGQAGPFLLTRVRAELGLTSAVFPPGVFYPIHYSEWYKPFMPEYTGEVNARSKASLAIHLWHSLVRYTNFDKKLLPDEDSFFGQAVLRHATAAYFKRRDRSEYLAHVTACRDMGLSG